MSDHDVEYGDAARRRWRKLMRAGQAWQPEDGAFFGVVQLASEYQLTVGEAMRWVDVGLRDKAKRLPYRVVRRGPTQDIVVRVRDWVDHMAELNPPSIGDDWLPSARRLVMRTVRRRESNRSYPVAILRDWLRDTKLALLEEQP
jgi:hypothetical protein